MTPRVSVVVPCHDGRRYLDECLASVARLDDPRCEVVVVDDGSTEPIADVVERWAPMARYIRQRNAGVSAARNTGVAATRGEYVRFLDCDDFLIDPAAARRQVDLLETHPDVGLVHGAARRVDTEGRAFGVRRPGFARGDYVRAGEAELADLLLGNHVTTSTVLARRAVLEAAGPFRTHISGGEDWDLWMRVAERAAVGYVDAPVTGYRVHDASVSQNYTPAPWLAMHVDVLERRFASPLLPASCAALRSAAEARVLGGAAVLAYHNRRRDLARTHALQAFDRARRVGDWRYGAACLWLAGRALFPTRVRRPVKRVLRGYRLAVAALGR